MAPPLRSRSILPGFGLSLGFTLAYLGLIVLIPLSAFLMGLIVVAIQFYAREEIVGANLRRWHQWNRQSSSED